jgi:formylglycine-generating enzyme required for sulfatase activity
VAAGLAAVVAVLAVAEPFHSAKPAEPAAGSMPPTVADTPASPPAAVTDPNRFRNPFGMTFARVPKGTARLGGTGGNAGPDTAAFEADFFLGATEVTQAEWDRVLGPGHNPSFYSRAGGHQHDVVGLTDDEIARLPADSLTWNDCQEFLRRLNELAPEPGWVYRLPTAREWEYACRGGPQDNRAAAGFDYYAGEPTLALTPDRANVSGGPGRPVPVGSYRPNRLGLYDMHGNACEYGGDRLGDAGEFRPLLGGWWMDEPARCRAVWRGCLRVDVPFRGAGLRVARVPAP